VSPGSPAERAGFKTGEMIDHVLNDSGMKLDEMDELGEGQRLTIMMSDGARRELVAREYY
jgi:hypothetical protein